jgi:hypothetical protein
MDPGRKGVGYPGFLKTGGGEIILGTVYKCV